jgi:hypothetical protein
MWFLLFLREIIAAKMETIHEFLKTKPMLPAPASGWSQSGGDGLSSDSMVGLKIQDPIFAGER